ncbi:MULTISPECIES: FkbM family methyltransferase [Inquilinus]|uniref:FkbM family methyltransferase n=1 Tax=Inquilinus ginsengisoli TaxID=363840 RepID=A0ABU1JLZ4_9PROT|nr:FkbM family methyltransferase [Inquilinus ginsengisoli]MDR6289358.1 FkbM family methyltransferase [Inquilinus ginsengisoli]
MNSLVRAAGIARSLAIYRGIPGRSARFRRFFSTLVRPGDLCFDIGAHVGNRSLCWADLGARVVAVEPQPDLAALLRRSFRGHTGITLVETAVGAAPGTATLHLSSRNPTVASLSPAWIETVSATEGFASVRWDRTVAVPVTTLDTLIERFGTPGFCKIDVEGFEAEVLAGLSRPLPCLSFEYVPAALPAAIVALDRVEALGRYRFQVSIGETGRFLWPNWRDGHELRAWLLTQGADDRSGDIYARAEG